MLIASVFYFVDCRKTFLNIIALNVYWTETSINDDNQSDRTPYEILRTNCFFFCLNAEYMKYGQAKRHHVLLLLDRTCRSGAALLDYPRIPFSLLCCRQEDNNIYLRSSTAEHRLHYCVTNNSFVYLSFISALRSRINSFPTL